MAPLSHFAICGGFAGLLIFLGSLHAPLRHPAAAAAPDLTILLFLFISHWPPQSMPFPFRKTQTAASCRWLVRSFVQWFFPRARSARWLCGLVSPHWYAVDIEMETNFTFPFSWRTVTIPLKECWGEVVTHPAQVQERAFSSSCLVRDNDTVASIAPINDPVQIPSQSLQPSLTESVSHG